MNSKMPKKKVFLREVPNQMLRGRGNFGGGLSLAIKTCTIGIGRRHGGMGVDGGFSAGGEKFLALLNPPFFFLKKKRELRLSDLIRR